MLLTIQILHGKVLNLLIARQFLNEHLNKFISNSLFKRCKIWYWQGFCFHLQKIYIMKKIIHNTLIFAFAAIFLTACSTANTATTGTSTVSRSDVSGTWTVSNVTLDGFPAGSSVSKVFDMAAYQDFQGSTWDLNGNGTGSISLVNGTVQPIYWSVNKSGPVNTFQFKKLNEGQRPKDVTTGYTLNFGEFSSGTAVFKTPVSLSNGQTAFINFNFNKK